MRAMFQSLFSWNLLLMDRSRLSQGVSRSRFNPCFRGTCSWWAAGHINIGRVRVSILVFVELALDAFTYLDYSNVVWSFNPCFRGTCSWCWDDHIPSWNWMRVSILVFVELALDALTRYWIKQWPNGFQSLFSWNLLLMFDIVVL